MIIGRFQRKPDETYTGRISTLITNKRVRIVPADDQANPDAPQYRIFSRGCEIGAGWDAQTNETPSRAYISILLDSPELATPVRVALFEGESDHYLIWKRRKDPEGEGQSARNVI